MTEPETRKMVRGIRGAISVSEDNPDPILEATSELIREILLRNEITDFDDIVSAVFTTTHDLVSCFPAEAARRLGMSTVPLLCALEIPVPTAKVPRCIRILLHVHTERTPREIEHVYLRDAANLRPDMTSAQ